ncbi:MAG: family 2 glycosyl transferase [Peptostreptococcaceae bacterium]|nr:family 2 glycosyl transferase [Peptostreptococcaceae bacterium]
MKKYLIICTLVFILFFTGIGLQLSQNHESLLQSQIVDGKSIKYNSYVQGDKIIVNSYKGEKETFITGVNIGLGKPGYYPGDIGITKQEYLRWFLQITDMNVNFIRVYTLQSPGFYDALFEFNRYANAPLYLIQGAYVNEALVEKEKDMWNKYIYKDFSTEVKNVIDAVHGNANIKAVKGHASGVYDKDVSAYVVSYLLGIEFDGETVTTTNSNNTDKVSFKGEYLYTKSESKPFEAMLASIGDFAVGYETENYSCQKMIAFSNWPTSDPLNHLNEPEEMNNMDGFDVEKIGSTDKFVPGMYASYHVYPYYPDFLNYEDQMQFIDKKTMTASEYTALEYSNPYRQYLVRLNQHHSIPVVIAEFGVPTSRGVTHEDLSRGYNQGGISEAKQGEMTISMLEDIKKSGLNGGIVFAWQDEWFKKTWNTMEQNTAEGRIRWHDVQTSEQNFGLLAFDPVTRHYSKEPLIVEKDTQLYTTYDEEYLWLKIVKAGIDLNNEKLQILIDTKKDKGIEFVINLDGKNNTRIQVESNYDPFAFLFSKQIDTKIDKEYSNINLRMRNKIYLPQSDLIIESSYYETGKLVYGNKEGDFYQTGNAIEIKIPWLLLNVSDPSTKSVLGNFNVTLNNFVAGSELPSVKTSGISLGLKLDGIQKNEDMKFEKITWDSWEEPKYIERLKDSYYYIKNALSDKAKGE